MDMDAVILAAGEGSRLDRESDHLPKIFVELDEEPLYSHQLKTLDEYCDRILFMLGHGFENDSSPRSSFSVPINISAEIEFKILPEWADYENGYTAMKALEEISNHVLLVCGDVIFKQSVVQGLISRFNQRCEQEEKNVVGAVQGVQEQMTAVRTGSDGNVSAYGAIEGHQEVGLFLLHKDNISRSMSILDNNANDWFPIIFEKTPSEVEYVNMMERHEINTNEHLSEAKSKFGFK